MISKAGWFSCLLGNCKIRPINKAAIIKLRLYDFLYPSIFRLPDLLFKIYIRRAVMKIGEYYLKSPALSNKAAASISILPLS